MDTLTILPYAGIAALVVLLIVFELQDGRFGKRTPQSAGYAYYTPDGSCVRMHKAFGSLYQVYVDGDCPVSTRQDRSGRYFTVRAGSAVEAEHAVDEIYRRGGDES